jgi:hypothetical protein
MFLLFAGNKDTVNLIICVPKPRELTSLTDLRQGSIYFAANSADYLLLHQEVLPSDRRRNVGLAVA